MEVGAGLQGGPLCAESHYPEVLTGKAVWLTESPGMGLILGDNVPINKASLIKFRNSSSHETLVFF